MSVERIEIQPVLQPLEAEIRPPGSKSITNRSLICAAAAEGLSRLRGVLHSEDTEVMVEALRSLGVHIEPGSSPDSLEVQGVGKHVAAPSGVIFVANSGTTIRFLTAWLAAAGGEYRLDGVPRMRERPIEDLLAALRQVGVDAFAERGDGCPPVRIRSSGLAGGRVRIRGDISSQYLSGLLLAAPLANGPVEIVLEGELVSKPYVQMTAAVMRAFGIAISDKMLSRFEVAAPQAYRPADYEIEPDASAASYFWAAAAIAGGCVRVLGLSRNSLQGDVAFCDQLQRMGCQVDYGDDAISVRREGPLVGVDTDMNAISDTVQTLAAVALFAEGPTRIRGVAHNRHKETDRIGDLARELRKLGARVEEHDDGLTIVPGNRVAAEIETYNDHRMAMSLALVGLKTPGVVIQDPACTAKTYPGFFEDFARLTQP